MVVSIISQRNTNTSQKQLFQDLNSKTLTTKRQNANSQYEILVNNEKKMYICKNLFTPNLIFFKLMSREKKRYSLKDKGLKGLRQNEDPHTLFSSITRYHGS